MRAPGRGVRASGRAAGARGRADAARGRAAGARVPDERGSGTVLAVGLLALVVTVAMGAATVGAAVVSRHRAHAAADLAALAGADVLGRSADVEAACRAASVVAVADGARLSECRGDDGYGDVVVGVRVEGRLGVATARARAGPRR